MNLSESEMREICEVLAKEVYLPFIRALLSEALEPLRLENQALQARVTALERIVSEELQAAERRRNIRIDSEHSDIHSIG